MNIAHDHLKISGIGIIRRAKSVLLMTMLIAMVTSPIKAQELGESKIELLDGSTLNASVASIDSEGLVSGNGIPSGLNLQDISTVTTSRTLAKNSNSSVTIIPAGGGKWLARNARVNDDHLNYLSQSGTRKLPLQTVRAIIWKTSASIEKTVQNPSKENDKIIVETADGERIVEGVIESIDATSLHVNYQGESKTIGIGKIKAVVMADLDLPAPQASSATINLIDGSQCVGTITGFSDGLLSVQIVGDATIKLQAINVIDITITSDRLLYLSDIDPIDIQERPMFSVNRPFRRDRSVENNPMAIKDPASGGDVSFLKGIGAQAYSKLVFENANEFDRFGAVVGIDAETQGRGDCEMAVWGDGIELWSQRIRATDGPQAVDLDITGMKEITLLINPGEKFDLGDHANWGNARFLKTKGHEE